MEEATHVHAQSFYMNKEEAKEVASYLSDESDLYNIRTVVSRGWAVRANAEVQGIEVMLHFGRIDDVNDITPEPFAGIDKVEA